MAPDLGPVSFFSRITAAALLGAAPLALVILLGCEIVRPKRVHSFPETCIAGAYETSKDVYTVDIANSAGIDTIEGVSLETYLAIHNTEGGGLKSC